MRNGAGKPGGKSKGAQFMAGRWEHHEARKCMVKWQEHLHRLVWRRPALPPYPPAQQLPSLPSRRTRGPISRPSRWLRCHDWLPADPLPCRTTVQCLLYRHGPSRLPSISILFARLHLQTQSRGSHHDKVTSSQFHPGQRLNILSEEDGSHTARMGTTGEAQRRRRDEHTLPAPNAGHDRHRQSFQSPKLDLLSRSRQRWIPIPATRSILSLSRVN